MSSQDFLNILLAAGFIIITICIVFVTFYFVQALKSISNLADNLDETTRSLKNRIQLKALAAIPAILVSLISRVIRKKRG